MLLIADIRLHNCIYLTSSYDSLQEHFKVLFSIDCSVCQPIDLCLPAHHLPHDLNC